MRRKCGPPVTIRASDNHGALARGSGALRASRSAGLALEAMIAIFQPYDAMNRAISVRCENGDRDEHASMPPSVRAFAVALSWSTIVVALGAARRVAGS